MRIKSPLFTLVSALIGLLPLLQPAATAQVVFVGNLDGVSNDSIFEPDATFALPALGWENVSGAAQIFDGASANGGLVGTDPFANYSVQYDTGVAIQPDTTYTLTFNMGFIGNLGATTATFSADLGTLNGGVFTSLGSDAGNATWAANMSSGVYSPETGLVVIGPFGSVSGDNLAVRLAQTSNPGPTDFFAFDNVTLTAVPEPEEYALAVGVGLCAWACLRRRKKSLAPV